MQTRLRAASCRKSSRAAAQQFARSQTKHTEHVHTPPSDEHAHGQASHVLSASIALRMDPPLSHRPKRASRAGLRCIQQAGTTPRLTHASHVQSALFLPLFYLFSGLASARAQSLPAAQRCAACGPTQTRMRIPGGQTPRCNEHTDWAPTVDAIVSSWGVCLSPSPAPAARHSLGHSQTLLRTLRYVFLNEGTVVTELFNAAAIAAAVAGGRGSREL